MASSLTNPALVFASNQALISASPTIEKLSNFATDFSAEAAQHGSTLKVSIYDTTPATPYDAATNNYGVVNGSIANISVTFTNRFKKTYAYNPTDWLEAPRSIWAKRGDAAGVALSRAIINQVSGMIVANNIDEEHVMATVTKANLASLRTVADNAGADPANTVLVLSPTAFSTALSLFDSNVLGSTEAIQNGVIRNLYGFKAVISLPLSNSATEKLVGALIPAEALIVAGRTIPADDAGSGAECGFTTDKNSGMTLGTYAYVSHPTREHLFTMEALFGTAFAQADKCVRIVSAATGA